MSFTMYGSDLLLRLLLTPEVVTAPTSLEVALTLSVPPRNATMAQLVEPADTYVRQSIVLDATAWVPTGFGPFYNANQVDFPQVVESWGLVVGWALVYAAAGECVNAGALMEPIATVPGMVPYVSPGALLLGLQD
jgi:hypothetical protein